MRATLIRWTIALAVSGVALFVAFRGVHWSGVGEALQEANYLVLAAAVPMLIVLIIFRAQRWRLLFRPDTSVRLSSAFAALNIGYMINNLLPFQIGELARAYVLGESENVSKVRALSTIAVERVLDTLTLLLMLGLLLPFVDLPRVAAAASGLILAVAIGAATLIAFAASDRNRAERWLNRLTDFLPSRLQETARGWVGSLLDGLSAVQRPRLMGLVVLWTAIAWLTAAGIFLTVLTAFDLDVPLTAAPFLLVATTFGFFVPSSPASIGVYDAISIRTLTEVFSVSHEEAVSYAIVAHVLFLLPATIMGATFFLMHHVSVHRIRSWGSSEPQASRVA
jgi:glycosyltransferase 2 family protein